MKDEEDMLELLDDEEPAEQPDLELDELDEETQYDSDMEPIQEVEEEGGEISEPESEARELEIDIRYIIVAVVALAAVVLAGIFFILPMMTPAQPTVITPTQSGEDLFLYLESGPAMQLNEVKFSISGAEIPPDRLMLMGGASWPWSQGTTLKIDTSGYNKPATLSVVSTKGGSETLIFSTPAEPTPTPTPTPEPTPEPVLVPETPGPQTNQTLPITTETRETGGEESVTNEMSLIQFSAEPSSGVQPLVVKFTDKTTVCAQNRTWSFGDGLNSSKRYTEHTYPFPGTYNASLDMTFCDPEEISLSPEKEIVVRPSERQDTILSGPGSAEVNSGGKLFVKIKGPGMSLRIGGQDYYLNKNDLVKIELNDKSSGSISITNNAIVQFNFEDVTIWINDEQFASGWLTDININQYSQIATSDIAIQITTGEPGLKGLVNAVPAIAASPGQIVTLHNVGIDSTGKLLFNIQRQAGFTFRGGIESFEITNPSV